MANTLTAAVMEVWAKSYQDVHDKVPVYPAISNFRLQKDLKKGDIVHRDYRSSLVANDVSSEGQFTRQDITDTDETLQVATEKETSFYLRDFDKMQNHLNVAAGYARDAAVVLYNNIDAAVFGEYGSFGDSIDAGDLGGTSGDGITVSTSNIIQLFSQTTKKLQRNNIKLDGLARFSGVPQVDAGRRAVAVLSPDVFQILLQKVEGKETAFGDVVAKNGHVGRFLGYDLFVSNGITQTATLAMATQPTDGDTVTMNGITFTFKTTLGSTAGNVLIGADADAARVNLEGLINNPGTTDSEGVALSAADQNTLNNTVATDSPSGNTLALVIKGAGYWAFSETFTDATDTWTAALEVQHCLFGVNDAIDVVVQKSPSVRTQSRDQHIGDDVINWIAYGLKVFNDSTNRMLDVQVRTDGYV